MHNFKIDSSFDEEKFGKDFLHQKGEQGEEQQLQEVKRPSPIPFTKRILIVDDNPDITLTFKRAFEEANRIGSSKIYFQVSTYNDPLTALLEFKPDFYDLMLIDINMPKMSGFDFCIKALEIDLNPRFCFMSSGLINQEALREQYPSLSIGCFIKKPITMESLIKRVKSELE